MLQNQAKILIVDDSATSRAVLRRRLVGIVAEIFESGSAADALELAAQHDFALILLDLQMPDMDGFEAIRRLRESPRAAATPVILMSAALSDPARRRLGYDLGAVDCIDSKPIDAALLQQKARVFIGIYQKRIELQQLALRVQHENQRLNIENEQFRAARSELLHQATHDLLTGLPNRMLFEDRLMSTIQRAQRNQRLFALAYIDLDQLKGVNDRFGHAAGDELLAQAAQRLIMRLRAADTVARLGGDEFAVILEDLDAADSAPMLGRRLLTALCEPLQLQSTANAQAVELHPAASIGLALYPLDSTDGAELLRLADRAMYRVKQAGGKGVARYQPESSLPQRA